MFGFLKPLRPDPTWRQSYARVCQFQKRTFGISSLPFLSYEAVFLHSLAIDAGRSRALPRDSPTCCRLRSLRGELSLTETRLGQYAAAFGILLAGVKLRDDVQDRGHWSQRLLWRMYRRRVERASAWLEDTSPGLMPQLDRCLADHAELESTRGSVSLTDVMRPTGEAFGLVFETCGRALNAASGVEVDTIVEQLRSAGQHLGRALIAWDCAVDFERDQQTRNFNPLRSVDDVSSALETSQLELRQCAWACPENSPSQATVLSVIDRVRARSVAPSQLCSPSRLERWGLIRQRGYSYARCDGCEVLCFAGELLQCCSIGGDAAICCAPGPVCPEPCGGADPCNSKPGAKSKLAPMPPGDRDYSAFHGLDEVTDGSLVPVGYVFVAGERVPARSADGAHIESGRTVRIVRTDPVGVTVAVLPTAG